jgi:hypothetical protein
LPKRLQKHIFGNLGHTRSCIFFTSSPAAKTMSIGNSIQKALEESIACAASPRFTWEYQETREEENTICHRVFVPQHSKNMNIQLRIGIRMFLSRRKYAGFNTNQTELPRNEAKDTNFSKHEPDPLQNFSSYSQRFTSLQERTSPLKSQLVIISSVSHRNGSERPNGLFRWR